MGVHTLMSFATMLIGMQEMLIIESYIAMGATFCQSMSFVQQCNNYM